MSASEEEENTGPVVPDPWLSLDKTVLCKRITIAWQDDQGEVQVQDLKRPDQEKHDDGPPPCPWKRIKMVEDNYEEDQVDLVKAWEGSPSLVQ